MSPKVSDEHKEQRKRQILDAAERVFIRKGYEPATLKDIVQETDMSRGWIYLYFQTKEEIFEALAARMDEENERGMEALLKDSQTVWEAIETMLSRQKEDMAAASGGAAPVYYEYFMTGWRDEKRRGLLKRRYGESIAAFAKLLQTGADRGEFAPQLPLELIAKIAASHIEGITTHALAVGPEQAEANGQIDALIAYIRQLLGVKNAL
ncbi:TetR family transcriptional regulator [Paenibacillus sp. MBLB4367]|uniref:TetR family transcriptional regulator n=1 Tax=Paenibacillus sp. MBLB4367 TaxID=3384767 RepID=UPI003907FCC1